jgi:hypothetical protein
MAGSSSAKTRFALLPGHDPRNDVIARSGSDEAIQSPLEKDLDCFAYARNDDNAGPSQATTRKDGYVRFQRKTSISSPTVRSAPFGEIY